MTIEVASDDRLTVERIMASGFSSTLGDAYAIIGNFLGMIEESSATLVRLERSKDGWYCFIVDVRKLA